MKIKMLKNVFDDDIKIWSKDDIYEVEKNSNTYWVIKEINGEKYAVSKFELNKEYEVII